MAHRSNDGNEHPPQMDDHGDSNPGPVAAAVGGAAAGPGEAGTGPAGAAGSGKAEALNPTEEDAYWRDNFRKRPYADETLSYDHYRPAYRYGWESRTRHADRRWDEVERELERGWRENRGESRLGWSDAKLAARDAWQRVEHRLADQRQRDYSTDA